MFGTTSKARPARAKAASDIGEPISAEKAYTLPQFFAASGLKDHALRQAQRKGLRVRRFGNKKIVLGRDWLDFLRTQPGDELEAKP